MLTRRQFAVGGAAMISAGALEDSGASGASVPFDTSLPIPKLIDAEKAGNAVKLRIASGRHAFVHGKPAATYGYSAPVLGPVIRVRRGDRLKMAVDNALDCDTTVHWHGLHIPGDVDGGPHQVIKPGGTGTPCSRSTSRRRPPGSIPTRITTPPGSFTVGSPG